MSYCKSFLDCSVVRKQEVCSSILVLLKGPVIVAEIISCEFCARQLSQSEVDSWY